MQRKHVIGGDKECIADFLNVVMFQGRQLVSSEGICDITAALTVSLSAKGKKYSIHRIADVGKEIHIKDVVFKLYMDNQEKIDYAMPERCMILEAASIFFYQVFFQ